MSYRFIDTDLFIQQTLQSSFAELVARDGWDGFRLRESMALQTVTAAKTVVATGGDAVLSQDNRTFMRNYGLVIYLLASANVLTGRLAEYPEDA